MRVGCPLSAISRHWLSGTCHFNLHRGSCYGNAQGSALGTLNGERSMAVQPATHARCALVPPRPGLAAKTEPRHCRAQSGWLARCRAQPWFLNLVVEGKTELFPLQLLHRLQSIEISLGRRRSAASGGPRTIDIDILNFDDQEIDEPDLVIPHPRLHVRAFALLPLLELEPRPMLAKAIAVGSARPEGDAAPAFAPLTLRS